MKRRHLLAGAAALPFAGLAVDVKSQNIYSSAAQDPAVRAFQIWRAAWQAENDHLGSTDEWETPEAQQISAAEWEARKTLAETVATTPAGIAGQLWLALEMFGTFHPDGDRDDPESYAFNSWKDEIDGQLMRNMLAGAQRLA